jgi:hypothetical protein
MSCYHRQYNLAKFGLKIYEKKKIVILYCWLPLKLGSEFDNLIFLNFYIECNHNETNQKPCRMIIKNATFVTYIYVVPL